MKCVLDADDPQASQLVGDVQSFLLASDGDPTLSTLLLELLETLDHVAGSGHAWTVALSGTLLHRLHGLAAEGLPRHELVASMHDALGACAEAAVHAAIPLGALPELHGGAVRGAWGRVLRAMAHAPPLHGARGEQHGGGGDGVQGRGAAAAVDAARAAAPQHEQEQRRQHQHQHQHQHQQLPASAAWMPPASVLKTGSCKAAAPAGGKDGDSDEDEFGWFVGAGAGSAVECTAPVAEASAAGGGPLGMLYAASYVAPVLRSPGPPSTTTTATSAATQRASTSTTQRSSAVDGDCLAEVSLLPRSCDADGASCSSRSSDGGGSGGGADDGDVGTRGESSWFFEGESGAAAGGGVLPVEALLAMNRALAAAGFVDERGGGDTGQEEDDVGGTAAAAARAASECDTRSESTAGVGTMAAGTSHVCVLPTPPPPLPPPPLLASLALALQHGHDGEMALAAAALHLAVGGRAVPHGGGRATAVSSPPQVPPPCSSVAAARWDEAGALGWRDEARRLVLPEWDACVTVRTLPGSSMSASRVVPGVAVLLEQERHRGLVDALTGLAGWGGVGGRGGGRADGVVHAVFVDGPLLLPSTAPPSVSLSSSSASMAADARAALCVAESREELAASAASAWLRATVGPRPCLLLVSGSCPPRIAQLLSHMGGTVVLDALGVRTLRGAAAAAGARPAGPQPWDAPSLPMSAGAHGARAAASCAGELRWWVYERGWAADHNVAYQSHTAGQARDERGGRGGCGGGSTGGAGGGGAALAASMLVLQGACDQGSASVSHEAAPGAAVAEAADTEVAEALAPSTPVVVLLHAPVLAASEASSRALRRCGARLQSAARHGCVLPGGGVWELQCAAWLRARATATTDPSEMPQPPQQQQQQQQPPQTAWRTFNARAAADREGTRRAVLDAVAGALEDVALLVLQNTGLGYAHAAGGVAAGRAALADAGWGVAQQQQQRAGMGVAQLSPADAARVQRAMLSGGDRGGQACGGGTGSDADTFVADDVCAREAGLRAVGTLAGLLLHCDARLTNQAGAPA
ncbi:hypothetical protein FOA52_002937 [Chlamydomonas sp. UWO 241]|nr:hypothetical protein FOA52_002937 [Chlamydomonas sp. UWO 241]